MLTKSGSYSSTGPKPTLCQQLHMTCLGNPGHVSGRGHRSAQCARCASSLGHGSAPCSHVNSHVAPMCVCGGQLVSRWGLVGGSPLPPDCVLGLPQAHRELVRLSSEHVFVSRGAVGWGPGVPGPTQTDCLPALKWLAPKQMSRQADVPYLRQMSRPA